MERCGAYGSSDQNDKIDESFDLVKLVKLMKISEKILSSEQSERLINFTK